MHVEGLRSAVKELLKEHIQSVASNIEALSSISIRGRQLPDEFGLSPGDLATLVSNTPPLRTSRIIGPAGRGSAGFAYVLDNDHVVKVFMNDYGMGGSVEKYAAMRDRQFAGTARRNEPAVYDVGHTNVDDIAYVEMGRVIPMDEWAKQLGSEVSKGFDSVMNAIDWLYEKKLLPHSPRLAVAAVRQRLAARSKAWGYTSDPLDALPQAALVAVIRAVTDYAHRVHTAGQTFDLGTQNIGVIPMNDPDEPDAFVLFDV